MKMNKIEKNTLAIEFNSVDYLGKNLNLNNYKGKKVLLSFFRGAACPFCNLRVNQLINRFSEFEKQGIQIIIFFAASKEEISEYAGQQKTPFPIVPDPNLEIYKKYRVEESSFGMIRAMINPFKMMRVMFSGFFNMKSIKDKPIVPADFLINENHIIHRVYYGKDFGDHIAIPEILDWKE